MNALSHRGLIVVGAVLFLFQAAVTVFSDSESIAMDYSVLGTVGAPYGSIRVGEGRLPGDKLDFRNDLDLNNLESIQFELTTHPVFSGAIKLSLETFILNGSATPANDVWFNGTLLDGHQRLQTVTRLDDFYRLTVLYQRDLVNRDDRSQLAADFGLTYLHLNFRLRGTIDPASPGHESEEDFYAQELPVPLLGLSFNYRAQDRLRWWSRIDGGWLPWIDSLRNEVGTVHLRQAHVDFWAGLHYRLTSEVALLAGYRFMYFAQHEVSQEDNNDISLSAHSLLLGAGTRF